MCMLVARVVSLSIDRTKPNWGGGGNDAVKNTNANEIQMLFAGYQKPAKLRKLSRNQCECGSEVLAYTASLFLIFKTVHVVFPSGLQSREY